MGKYRKIDPRIWNDIKFNSLSVRARLAYMFMLTHPNLTALGAMRATLTGLASELNGVSEVAFREALSKGLFKVDEQSYLVWFPNFLRYNKPESPNVVTAWGKALDLLPECDCKLLIVNEVKTFLEGYSKGFQEAWGKASRRVSGNQEQEQEHKQDQEQNNNTLNSLLIDRGVSEVESARLVRDFATKTTDWKGEKYSLIEFYCELWDYESMQPKPPSGVGWLVKAIENEYKPSKKFRTQRQIDASEMEHRGASRKRHADDLRKQEAEDREGFESWQRLSVEDRWELYQVSWRFKFFELNKRKPMAQEISEAKQEYLHNPETADAYQIRVFGEVKF